MGRRLPGVGMIVVGVALIAATALAFVLSPSPRNLTFDIPRGDTYFVVAHFHVIPPLVLGLALVALGAVLHTRRRGRSAR